MTALVPFVLVGLVLASLAMLAGSRVRTLVRGTAAQGLLLGLFPVLATPGHLEAHMVLVAAVTLLVKGILLPRLLMRTMRRVGVRREVEPYVGYTASLVVGCGALAFSVWVARRLDLGPILEGTAMAVPVSFLTMFVGLFLVVTRRKALTQAIGFLAFDNGIFLFGLAFVGRVPVPVELGVLLDAFVVLAVMGIAIHQIQHTFEHTDADRLDGLKG